MIKYVIDNIVKLEGSFKNFRLDYDYNTISQIIYYK